MDVAAAIIRHARTPGIHRTPIEALQIIRTDAAASGLHSLLKPSLCFIVQGHKQVTIGATRLRYGANEFLYAAVDLPITGEVTEATAKRPYLCLVLEIEPSVVFDLVSAADGVARPAHAQATPRAILVGKDATMAEAFHRLIACLANPVDARVLAPTVIREITYRLLRGPFGDTVREVGIADSRTQRIAGAIERLKREYAKPQSSTALARIAGMSVSSFHAHFKKVTTLSPLQYQKHLRLHEARRILIERAATAAEVAFEVGYESASQFSREYARFFGLPPIADVRRST